MIFASRALASSVVARRRLWLRAWQADMHSKQLVAAYKGGKLFGLSLEKILVETRDKKKALLKSLHRPTEPTLSFLSLSFEPLPRPEPAEELLVIVGIGETPIPMSILQI